MTTRCSAILLPLLLPLLLLANPHGSALANSLMPGTALLAVQETPTDSSATISSGANFAPTGTGSSAADPVPAGLSIQVVPLLQLREKLASGLYVPIPRNRLGELTAATGPAVEPAAVIEQPRIREASYSAEFQGTQLQSGQLDFTFYDQAGAFSSGPLLLGSTNLQNLTLRDTQGLIPLAADSDHRLFLLRTSIPSSLNGTWIADGQVAGDVVTFRLELPASTTSRVTLTTSSQTLVTAPGSLVLGPYAQENKVQWTIIPADASRFIFSCRRKPGLAAQTALPLSTFAATHALAADLLTSRWTLAFSSPLDDKTSLTAKISRSVRISDVSLDDKRPVQWSVREENGQSLLTLLMPQSTSAASLTVTGASVLPQKETWDIPMLSPLHWTSDDGKKRGPILTPVGQMNVLLPATVELDEWILVGIQERDVVTRPDQSREYQLVQFLPEASAAVRTSTSPARLTDSVVTLVEPAGRLATVRCLVNVRCEGSSVVELKWPVAAGWQVIAARYASNERSLFFEFPESAPDDTSTELTIHLPETLDSGASRVLELQFQQSDVAVLQSLQLPLLKNSLVDRSGNVVVFPPAFSLNSDFQQRWSTGRRLLSTEEFQRQASWFPAGRLTTDMRPFDVSESGTNLPATPPETPLTEFGVQIEFAAQLSAGLLTETTQIELPASTSQMVSSFLVPADIAGDLRWSVDGEPVAARRDTEGDPDAQWRRWILPPGTIRSGISSVIRCETRRAVRTGSRDFVAAIIYPETDLRIRGTMQLFASDAGILSVEQLSRAPIAQNQDTKSRAWLLPTQRTIIRLQIEQNSRIQQGQTIDVQMLHLLAEKGDALQHEVLAIANISRLGGRDQLPLSLPTSYNPLVLVNGHRVQLMETKEGLFVPLPANATECRILLTWTEPEIRIVSLTGSRLLPRLFHNELAEPQSTHHLLIDPLLELKAPGTMFASAETTDMLQIMKRVPGGIPQSEGTSIAEDSAESEKDSPTSQTVLRTSPKVRSFATRWQLAANQEWQSRTLIDAAASNDAIQIEVTRVRRRLAIFAGTFLVLIGSSLIFRSFLNQHRLTIACATFGLLGLSFFATTHVQIAVLRGAFWGVTGGMLLILVSRWKGFRPHSGRSWLARLRSAFSILMFIGISFHSTSHSSAMQQAAIRESDPIMDQNAREQSPPDVLIPETSVSEVVYARKTLVDASRLKRQNQSGRQPATVVTSMHSTIQVDASETVEVLLTLGVAAASGDHESLIRIPLQGALLEECRVDGILVAPERDDAESIIVSIPGTTVLPGRPLQNQDSFTESTPENDNSVDTASTAATVSAGPLPAFTIHTVECRLRPLTTRQAAGVQFRLPALPSPDATIEVKAPKELYSRARAQNSTGTIQWNPTDGIVPFNSLAMADWIDMRLFQASIEKGSPRIAGVETMAIGERLAGQYQINSISRFRGWNPLTSEVRYRIPQDFELLSASASVGPDMADLLWSVNDQNAVIQLPGTIRDDFFLSLLLKTKTPATALTQSIPVAELQQFADCTIGEFMYFAVRPNAVFSVLPPDGQQITTASFPDLQTTWGQWLRRSDTVFRIPQSNVTCAIRLTPKESRNEVRLDQSVTLKDAQINWKFQFDIDTTVLPVFRHRVNLEPAIVITDVQVVAGEANRLASWHRKGDQLVIQLREGTTGLHQISLTGRQPLRPDDVLLTFNSPRLQRAQILESSLTLMDNDGLGLTFQKLGGAVPDQNIEDGAMLLPETPIRMTIVREQDPVVLKRSRPVEPTGTIAAIRSSDQITFLMRVSRWSGALGPLHLNFPDEAKFLTEPVVLTESLQMPLIREANDFSASQDLVKALFDEPEFIVYWTAPIPTEPAADSAVFSWPEIFDGIRWSDILLVPLDAETGSQEDLAGTNSLPEWLTTAAARSINRDLTALKARMISLPTAQQLVDRSLSIPVRNVAARQTSETPRDLFAVTDSTVWMQPNQSAVGDTLFVIFASRLPERCTIRIPPGTVVTELESAEPARWQNTGREQVTIELTSPVTTFRARWMSERAEGTFMTVAVNLAPPFPFDCEARQRLSVYASNGELPTLTSTTLAVPAPEFETSLTADLQAGLSHSQPPANADSNGAFAALLPSLDSLLQLVQKTQSQFLQSTGEPSAAFSSATRCRPSNISPVRLSLNRRVDWSTVAAVLSGAVVLIVAAFARLLNSFSLPSLWVPSTQPQTPVVSPTTIVTATAPRHKVEIANSSRSSVNIQSNHPSHATPDRADSSVEVRGDLDG